MGIFNFRGKNRTDDTGEEAAEEVSAAAADGLSAADAAAEDAGDASEVESAEAPAADGPAEDAASEDDPAESSAEEPPDDLNKPQPMEDRPPRPILFTAPDRSESAEEAPAEEAPSEEGEASQPEPASEDGAEAADAGSLPADPEAESQPEASQEEAEPLQSEESEASEEAGESEEPDSETADDAGGTEPDDDGGEEASDAPGEVASDTAEGQDDSPEPVEDAVVEGDPAARAKHAQHAGGAEQTGYDVLAGGLFPEIPKKKSRKGLKIFGVMLGIFVLLLAALYVAGIFVFGGRFLPHTVLGEHDISLRTDAEVVQLLRSDVEDYAIEVKGGGFSYEALGSDLGVDIDADGVVAEIHRTMPAWKWPYYLLQPSHDMTDLLDVSFKRGSCEQPLAQAIDEFNKTATPPQNATIGYDETARKFVVEEEVPGTQIDPAFTMEAFAEAIADLNPELIITDEFLVQPAIRSDDEKLVESAELASGMTSADLTLIMNGREVRKITGADLSHFVSIDDKLDVIFDEAAMDAWCGAVANDFNTVGTQRTYTRPDGKVVTVKGGVYGWEIDEAALKDALIDGIKAGKKAEVEVPFLTEAATFTGPGEADWGKRYIDVDIAEQHVRFYNEAGELFWETDCITGAPDGRHNTVEGVWKLNDKESPSLLKGYENGKKIYETKVTFWMPFEGNSIGFHDATWQPGFGGTMYANGYGSHGCVNLSYRAAEELYGLIREGDVVIVHS